MSNLIQIPVGRLQQRFVYHHETGFLFKRLHDGVCGPLQVAGRLGTTGYIRLKVGRRSVAAHRVAFAMYYGRWPEAHIDHANGIKTDNRIENLREATASQNIANTRLRKDNSVGLKGVTFSRRDKIYQARVTVMGKQIHLGNFKTPEDAHKAYIEAAHKHFGVFARIS